MTTVKQLIEFLQKQNPEARVRILEERQRHYETYTQWKLLDLEQDAYIFPSVNGTTFLDLGSK